jgi:hypothetical protein
VKLTTHLHLVPRSKNARFNTSTSPIRLHEAVLTKAQGQLYLYLQIFIKEEDCDNFLISYLIRQMSIGITHNTVKSQLQRSSAADTDDTGSYSRICRFSGLTRDVGASVESVLIHMFVM